MGAVICSLVTVQGVVLRTSSAISFDRHKKGPEEGLSCDLLGGAVLQGWVQTGRTALCARGLLTVHTWMPQACLCSHFIFRAGHVAPSRCRGWRSVPSVRWEEGESWRLVYHDSSSRRTIAQMVKRSAERRGYWSTVTSLECGRTRPGT